MAARRLDGAERCALHRHQLKPDGQEELTDDVEARGRQQVVHIADAARDGILNGDHAQIGIAIDDGGEGILKARAG